MNKTQKQQLAKLGESIDIALSELTDMVGEQQDVFDELSEKAKEGEKGEAQQEVIDQLESAVESLESVNEVIAQLTN